MEGDRIITQEELDNFVNLIKWTGMKFNNAKCSIMHVWINTKNFCYKLQFHGLEEVEKESNYAVLVNQDDHELPVWKE